MTAILRRSKERLHLEVKSKVSDYNFLSIKGAITNWYNEQFYNKDDVVLDIRRFWRLEERIA